MKFITVCLFCYCCCLAVAGTAAIRNVLMLMLRSNGSSFNIASKIFPRWRTHILFCFPIMFCFPTIFLKEKIVHGEVEDEDGGET